VEEPFLLPGQLGNVFVPLNNGICGWNDNKKNFCNRVQGFEVRK